MKEWQKDALFIALLTGLFTGMITGFTLIMTHYGG